MNALEIVAIILTAIAGSSLITSLILFAVYVIKDIKERPNEKLLVGFAVAFILATLFIFIAVLFIAIAT